MVLSRMLHLQRAFCWRQMPCQLKKEGRQQQRTLLQDCSEGYSDQE